MFDMKCSTCGTATSTVRMCKSCGAAYARNRRRPRVVIGIAQLEDVETGEDAFVVVSAPNKAAVDAGWSNDRWGPYKTLSGAQRRAKRESDALDAWAPEQRGNNNG